MLRLQQSDGAQIQGLLSVRQARSEFLQPRGEELCTLALQVRVRILRHKQKQQLWIARRCHAVYSFQIFEFRANGAGLAVIPGAWAGGCCSQLGQENSEHQQRSQQIDSGSHKWASFPQYFNFLTFSRCIYMYYRYKQLRRHRGLCNSRDRLLYALPVRVAKFSPQSLFRPLPVPLRLCHFSLASLRETEQALPPVLSAPHANPPLLQQQPQRPRQRRTIHSKARTRPLLIGLFSRSQGGKQANCVISSPAFLSSWS